MSGCCHLHGRFQDNFSHKTKLESCVSIMSDMPSQEQVSRGQLERCDHQMSGDCRTATRSHIVNNVPAHMPQAHSVSLHQQQQQRHHMYQAVPNSHFVQHVEEVPMYKRAEPPRNCHGYPSLVQSTPHHSQPFHYSGFSNNQYQQRLPLEHLEMPSASTAPVSTFNGSSRVASTGSTSFSNHISLNCSTAEDEPDQPINLSLKQQDVSSSDRDNISFSSGHVRMPYGFLASFDAGSNFGPHMAPEYTRPTMKGNNCLQNNVAANIKGSVSSFSSSSASTNRPVRSLIHSHFDTPRGYPPMRVPYHQDSAPHPQFMTPQAPYVNTLLHPRGHLHPSGRNPCSNLRPNDSVSHSGGSSEEKLLNTGAVQFHTLQTAHRSALHPSLAQPFNKGAYAETDLDIVINQLTNFSHRHKDVSEDNCCDGRREKLADYYVHFHDSRKKVDQNIDKYRDGRHCVDYMNAGPRGTNDSSNCDRIQTYRTEGIPNLSTATSIAGFTPTRKVEREEMAIGVPKQIKSTIEMNSVVSSTDMVVASTSGSQRLDRQTETAVMAACKGQGLGAVFPKYTSQSADDHMVQENLYSCVDFNEGALDQTKTYYEEGTPTSFSSMSSHSGQLCADPREATATIEFTCSDEASTPKSLNKFTVDNNRAAGRIPTSAADFRHTDTDVTLKENLEFMSVTSRDNNQVEDTPLMFSRNTSPGSLSSCDTQPFQSSVASEYSWKASEVVSPSEIPDSPSELMPPALELTHSPTRQFKDMSLTTKSTNAVAKRSLMTPSRVAAESWGIVPAVDEGKSINFAAHREPEDSHLMFSVLQKNSQNTHLVNHVLNSQAEVMPMIEEQHVETESASGKSEVIVEHAKEKISQDLSESTCAISIASSLTRDVSEYSDLQEQPREPSLPTVEGRECALQAVDKQDAPAGFSAELESQPVKDAVKHEDSNTSVSHQDSDSCVSGEDSDSSVSDVSQEEADILAQCITFGMPASAPSAHKIKCKRQFVVGMTASCNPRMGNPARMSSILKSVPKKLAPFFNSPPDNITSDNLMETEDCPLQLEIPENKARSQLAELDTNIDRNRSTSRDSHLSDSSCSSTTLHIARVSKNLKQIGGKIESPESRVRLGAVFELSDECSLLEQAYFQSVPLQLRSAL